MAKKAREMPDLAKKITPRFQALLVIISILTAFISINYLPIQEAMGAYGMTRDQISYYVHTYKVPRIYRDNRVYIERASLDKVLGIPKI